MKYGSKPQCQIRKLLVFSMTVALLLVPLGSAAAYDNVFNQLYTGTRDNYTGRVGFSFRAEQDFAIEALGRSVNPDYNGGVLQIDHTVELFEVSSGNLLASVVIDSSSPKENDYAFEYCVVELSANSEYMLLSDETSGSGDPWSDAAYMTNYDASYISILGGEWGSSAGNPMPTQQKAYGDNAAYVPPTFSILDAALCGSDCDLEELMIDPADLTATASSTSPYGTPPANAVSGAGMTDDAHDTDYQNMWLSAANYGNEWFKIDLGDSYVLGTMKVWNYNQSGWTCRGVKQADIYYSNSSTDPDGDGTFDPGNWTLLGTAGEQTFTKAPGTEGYNTPDTINCEAITAHWVCFDINSYHCDTGYNDVGLSEIRFYRPSNCASEPDPSDSATNIRTSVTLSWTQGQSAISHDVYMGTSYSAVCDANDASGEFKGNQTATTYYASGLDFQTDYFWRVDEVDASNTYKGRIWRFATGSSKATNPRPVSSQTDFYPYHADLIWDRGASATSHDVYLGTDYEAVDNATTASNEFKGNQTATYYDISGLDLYTTYYWRIDEVDASSTYKGDVWNFTTASPNITGSISAIENNMPDMPSPYAMRDWKQVARDYDALFFDFDATGDYLPLTCWDTDGYNTGRTMFSTRGGYVGDYYAGCSGHLAEEMAVVIGSTLCGIDKSQQWCDNTSSYQNYVLQMENYYDPEGGVYAYSPAGSYSGSGWYIDYSAQMFTELYSLYDRGVFGGDMTGNDFDDEFATQAQKWFDAGILWGGSIEPWIVPTDIPRGFYFPDMTVANDWVSDAPGGYAWIMYMAYQKLGDPNYLCAAEWGLQALLKNTANPGKEADIFYAPVTAARLNAEAGRKYDLQKLFEWCMSANHSNGWGVMSQYCEAPGGEDMYGLVGADWDVTGGGFSGCTFDAFHLLVPVARYDDRFAHSIGKFALNCANSSNYFYGGSLPEDHYYDADINWINAYDPNNCMPAEIARARAYRQNRTLSDYNLIYGTIVDGSHSDTHGYNAVYEVLEEENVGNYDALEHVWDVQVQPARDNYFELRVWAHRTDGGDGDDGFIFSWSTSPTGGFNDLFTVTATSEDPMHVGAFNLTITEPATIYIKVKDNNRSSGKDHDTLHIDDMLIWQECQWGPSPCGDAIAACWSETNLAPYCGHRVGLMGACVDKTNVTGILQLDLLATDVFGDPDAYPSYLYYNPHDTSQTVNIDVGQANVDIYDAASETFIKSDVSGNTSFTIGPDSAVVAVLAPAGGNITYDFRDAKRQMLIEGVVVDYVGSIPADFDGNNRVDFRDFAFLAARWLKACSAGNDWCNGADLNQSGAVGLDDLSTFASLWLQ